MVYSVSLRDEDGNYIDNEDFDDRKTAERVFNNWYQFFPYEELPPEYEIVLDGPGVYKSKPVGPRRILDPSKTPRPGSGPVETGGPDGAQLMWAAMNFRNHNESVERAFVNKALAEPSEHVVMVMTPQEHANNVRKVSPERTFKTNSLLDALEAWSHPQAYMDLTGCDRNCKIVIRGSYVTDVRNLEPHEAPANFVTQVQRAAVIAEPTVPMRRMNLPRF